MKTWRWGTTATAIVALAACSHSSFRDDTIAIQVASRWQVANLSTKAPQHYKLWRDPEQLQIVVFPGSSPPIDVGAALDRGTREIVRRPDFQCAVSSPVGLPVETAVGTVYAKSVNYTCTRPGETVAGALFVAGFEQSRHKILIIAGHRDSAGLRDIQAMVASLRIREG